MTDTSDMDLRSYKVSESDSGFALKIECYDYPVPIERPYVKIIKQANEHTRAIVTGLISEDTYETFALRISSQTDLKITYHVEGEEVFLFQGVIQKLEVDTQGLGSNIVYKLELEALSYTCLMDIEKKSRSFQDGSMTYDGLLSEVMVEYDQSAFLNYAAEGQSLGSFTMQYKETDWEFLKRMASRFFVPLIADHKSGGPRFSLGVCEGNAAVVLEDSECKVIKEAEKYREIVQNYNASMNEIDFIFYEVRSSGPDMESLQVGDMVWFQNRLFFVISVQAEVKDYLLSHTYRLGVKNGYFCPPVFNQLVGGLSVTGTVIKVARNMLKVHLDIDHSQPEESAHWFQYATFYSTWYCMPEIGDRVNVHFPTVEESEGIVLNSVRKPLKSSSDGQSGNQASPDTSGEQMTALNAEEMEGTFSATGVSASGGGVNFSSTNNQSAGTQSGGTHANPNGEAAGSQGQGFDLAALSGDEKVKMIATESGKMLILDDRSGKVSIVCSDNTYITLSGSGISIITDLDVNLSSDKDININAKESITMDAETELKLTCGGSVIEVNPSKILVHGVDIKLNS